MTYETKQLEFAKKYLTDNHIDAVEVGVADINGAIVGKRLPASFLLKNLDAGTGICRAPLTWDIQNEYFSTSHLAGFEHGAPDMILKPDYTTLRKIPWRNNTAFVIADIDTDKGERIAASTRQVLKNVLARLNKYGFTAKVGSEIEFYLLDDNKRPLFTGKECYSIRNTGNHSSIIDQLQQNLEQFQIPVEAIHPEYGPGQMEIILEYSDALTHADNTIIARNTIKETARKNGLHATFMARLWDNESGSGYHLHQSLWTKDGKNAFAENKQLLEQYTAGLLASTQEFTALICPTVNSYKRLENNSFAPTKVGVGYDNRTVTTRLLGHGKSTRVEHRIGAADANAYLLIAANIAAGIYGLEHKLPAPNIIEGNGHENESLPKIPRTLYEAALLFDESKKALDYFGKDFVDIFSELIHFDIAVHNKTVTDWERDRYLENS